MGLGAESSTSCRGQEFLSEILAGLNCFCPPPCGHYLKKDNTLAFKTSTFSLFVFF